MNFRTRYYLAFPPLFLGLTAAAVGLSYAVQRHEISWALAGQAGSRALCLASFLGNSDDAGPAVSTGGFAGGQSAAARLAEAAGDLTAVWFEPDGTGWRARTLVRSAALGPAPLPAPELFRQLRAGGSVALNRRRVDAEYDESIGYAAVLDKTGRLRAVIGTTEKDQLGRSELHDLERTSVVLSCVALLAGLLVAEGLARRTGRDIAALTAGAHALSRNDDSHPWRTGGIRELEDLSKTLQAIGQIQKDRVRQSVRRLLRAEPLPSEDQVAAAYRRVCASTGADDPVGKPPHAARAVGEPNHDEFWLLRRSASACHLAVGRLEVPASPPMSSIARIMRAHAARAYLAGLLVSDDSVRSWKELDALLPVETGESARLAAETSAVAHHGFAVTRRDEVADPAPGGTDVREATVAESVSTERLDAIGTLDPDAMKFARQFLRTATGHTVERAADELAALLGQRARGLLLVFSHSAPSK